MGAAMIQWYVQDLNNRHMEDQNYNKLIYILQEEGCKLHTDKYKPFESMQYDFFDKNQPVVLHGSIAMIKDYQRRYKGNYSPAAWMDLDKTSCHSYYVAIGKFLL